MPKYQTDQEQFWASEFGDEYTLRNQGRAWVASNLSLFAKILHRTENIGSVLEFGANLGLNLQALRQLLPEAQFSALEINETAVTELEKLQYIKTYHTSIQDFVPDYQRDLALIKGVLIHINPGTLPQVYDLLYQTSRRYICVAEYYNPSPVEIPYRGHVGKLFKRDFAGEMMDRYPDLRLVDYGFAYHRDTFPQDDITWFLMEKQLPDAAP